MLSNRIEDLNEDIKSLRFKKFQSENTDSNFKSTIKEINASTSMILNFKKLWKNADYSMRRLLINSFVDFISYNSDTKEVIIKLFCSKKGVI